MMNDTANIPSGKMAAYIGADSIRLPKPNTPCFDFHYVGNRLSVAVELAASQV